MDTHMNQPGNRMQYRMDDRLDRNRINQFDSRRMQDRMDQRHQMMDGRMEERMDQRQMMDGRMQSYRMENTDMYQNQNRVDFRRRQNMMNRFNRNQMNRFKRDADSDVVSYRTMTETPFQRSKTEVYYEDANHPRILAAAAAPIRPAYTMPYGLYQRTRPVVTRPVYMPYYY